MAQLNSIFWDVGGVLLTNAWDHAERSEGLARFGLDKNEFDERHEKLFDPFERGEITLDEYLDQTVFYEARPFTREAFRECMFSASKPDPAALHLARELARAGKYRMGTINNESRELNAYRIRTFGLAEIFSIFVSSCYVGVRKPEDKIYRIALDITQKSPEECCFIDDRRENLETAARLGMETILMENSGSLRKRLEELGVSVSAG